MVDRYPGRGGVRLSRANDGFVRQRPALPPHDVRIAWRSARPCVTYSPLSEGKHNEVLAFSA